MNILGIIIAFFCGVSCSGFVNPCIFPQVFGMMFGQGKNN